MILPVDSIDLDHYSAAELLSLHNRILTKLPSSSLNEVDLSKELVQQFFTAKALLEAAQDDDSIPLNQKAQTLNTITSILKTLGDAQRELYGAERLRALETTLINTLKQFPGLETAFINQYERALSE